MFKVFSFSLIMAIIGSFPLLAQEVTVRGQFLADSVKVGMPLYYVMKVKSPQGTKLLLPDSTYDFSPFECNGITYTPTHSDGGASYDSVAYELVSFEVDDIQALAVPVFKVSGKDSIRIGTAPDTVFFSPEVKELPKIPEEPIVLKEDTVFRQVALQFNYLYLMIGTGLFIILGAFFYFAFGKKLLVLYKLRQLKGRHERFLSRFTYSDDLGAEESSRVLLLWKTYMEQLEGLPYTKLSTKEVVSQQGKDSLRPPLESIDRMIYGGHSDGPLAKSFGQLREYSDTCVHRKAVQIKNE